MLSFLASILAVPHFFWWVLFPLMAIVAAALGEARGSAWSRGALLVTLGALLASIALGFTAMVVDMGGGSGMHSEVRAFFDNLYVHGFFSKFDSYLALLDTILSIFGWFVVLAAIALVAVVAPHIWAAFKVFFERNAPFSRRWS